MEAAKALEKGNGIIKSEDYIFLVWKVTRSIRNKPSFFEYEDLFQIGYIGLLKAIKNFDNEKGAFIVYAKNIIKYEILEEIRKSAPLTAYEEKKIKTDINLYLKELENDYAEKQKRNVSIIFGDPFDINSLCHSEK